MVLRICNTETLDTAALEVFHGRSGGGLIQGWRAHYTAVTINNTLLETRKQHALTLVPALDASSSQACDRNQRNGSLNQMFLSGKCTPKGHKNPRSVVHRSYRGLLHQKSPLPNRSGCSRSRHPKRFLVILVVNGMVTRPN